MNLEFVSGKLAQRSGVRSKTVCGVNANTPARESVDHDNVRYLT
jgi:hypothetical protein